MVLIKVSDISNEARPMDVAEPWLDCLLTEFYEQSDLEKKEGLPVTPFMVSPIVSAIQFYFNYIEIQFFFCFSCIKRTRRKSVDPRLNVPSLASSFCRYSNRLQNFTRSLK